MTGMGRPPDTNLPSGHSAMAPLSPLRDNSDFEKKPSLAKSLFHRCRFLLALLFIVSATTISVLPALYMPSAGAPVDAYLPPETAALLRISDSQTIQDLLQSNREFQNLWANEEFRQISGIDKTLEKARGQMNKYPFLNRLIDLEFNSLRFLLSRDTSVALIRKSTEEDKTSLTPLVFLRLQGARGALLRMVVPHLSAFKPRTSNNPKIGKASWHDLGGGLIAIGFKGVHPGGTENRPSASSNSTTRHPSSWLPRPFMELTLFPPIWPSLHPIDPDTPLPEHLMKVPSWNEVLNMKTVPERIHLRFVALQQGGIIARGAWKGSLPTIETTAPLIDAGYPEDMKASVEIQLPIKFGALFDRILADAYRLERNRRRWGERLDQLASADVDLHQDLWPQMGHALRLQIWPASERSATGQGLLLASVPFKASIASRHALTELCRTLWKGLYEGKPDQDAKRPYVKKSSVDDHDYFALVKGNFTRPMLLTTAEAMAFISDGVPVMLKPTLKKLPITESGEEEPVLLLRSNGMQFAPIAASLTQLYLEDLHDDLGASAFLEKVPDEQALVKIATILFRMSGTLEFILNSPGRGQSGNIGRLTLHWSP